MIRIPCARLTIVVLAALTSFLGGCASTRHANFYTLQPIPSAEKPPAQSAAPGFLSLGVGPVQFPDYLDRPQIVTRIGANEVKITEFERWAGDLNASFTNTLAENLSILLGADRVSTYPWQHSTKVNYQVTLDILQFDGTLGEHAVLIARWTIHGRDGRKSLFTNKSALRVPVTGAGYQDLVSAENRLVTELSREIAAQIAVLARNEPAYPE